MKSFLILISFLLVSNNIIAQKPRVIHLIDIGKHPHMPAFMEGISKFQKKYEPFFMHEPAGDTWCYNGEDYFNDTRVPIGRFRTAIHNDFAARILWTVNPVYTNANHPPVAIINDHSGRDFVCLSAAPGEKVNLSAGGSGDPDGDKLSFQWWRYAEADS
jgi:hypothetical protein